MKQEYRRCAWTNELCRYPQDFQNFGYSYKGKKMYMALLNKLRVNINGKLVSMTHTTHPNHILWNDVVQRVRKKNNYPENKRWLSVELIKKVYFEVYKKLKIEMPNLNYIENGPVGKDNKLKERTESLVLDYFNITDDENHRQVNIGKYRVDGVADDNVIYEYNGDFWHGNPVIYKSTSKLFGSLTAGDKWKKDKERLDVINKKGYDVKVIWEKDWNDFQNKVISEIDFLKSIIVHRRKI
jgi:very-short-patch-repair endonuclease